MKRAKLKSIIEILSIFVLPVALLYWGVIPTKYTIAVLALFSVIILGIVLRERWALQSLGIRTDNVREGLAPYTMFTAIGVVSIVLYAKFLNKAPIEQWWTDYHFTFLFFPISLLQEFAFRGYLMPRLRTVFSSAALVILTNAVLFTLIHSIYPNPEIMLPLAFAGGLGFALAYHFYPNLILISLSHSALNFTAVLYSFFSHPSS